MLLPASKSMTTRYIKIGWVALASAMPQLWPQGFSKPIPGSKFSVVDTNDWNQVHFIEKVSSEFVAKNECGCGTNLRF